MPPRQLFRLAYHLRDPEHLIGTSFRLRFLSLDLLQSSLRLVSLAFCVLSTCALRLVAILRVYRDLPRDPLRFYCDPIRPYLGTLKPNSSPSENPAQAILVLGTFLSYILSLTPTPSRSHSEALAITYTSSRGLYILLLDFYFTGTTTSSGLVVFPCVF